ncbi:MAG: SDR family NAD(P)-dependent oxidoreductase [Chloroflexi bacterium]|nr:SDR family NAD(P)-dependent oxidoreductase [Chloroflexota bacterium]
MGVKALELDGKVVVVVGASRGCGKYFAMGLAKEGATVIVGARTASPGGPLPGTIYETAQQITDAGGKAWPVRCDATIPGDLHHIVGQAVYRYGRIDALVYNAAVYDREPFTNITPDAFDRYFAVNVRGPFIAAQAAVPHMVAQGGGSIVNIVTVGAYEGGPGIGTYSSSKAALPGSKQCNSIDGLMSKAISAQSPR